MKSANLVSVIIPSRNRPELLRRALLSVRSQTWSDFEVIVADDGSSEAVQQEYELLWRSLDKRFVLDCALVPGSAPTGPSAPRNRAIARAHGEFVAFLDDDDLWVHTDHLQVAISALTETCADFYFTDIRIESFGKPTMPTWHDGQQKLLTMGRRIGSQTDVFEVPIKTLVKVMRHRIPAIQTIVMRRNLLEAIGGFSERIFRCVDHNMTLRTIDRANKVLFRPECAAIYDVTPHDCVTSSAPMTDFARQSADSYMDASIRCNNPLLAHVAQCHEAWQLRQLARILASEGRKGAALSIARKAFCLVPTLGSALAFAKLLAARKTIVDSPNVSGKALNPSQVP